MRLIDRLRRADRSGRLTAGPGALVHSTPYGRVLRAKRSGSDFDHPWRTTLLGEDSAIFQQGTVNGLRATIKGVPLAGDAKNDQPELALPQIRWNNDGLAWFCVECTFQDPSVKGASGSPWAILKAEMVQVADPDEEDPSTSGKPFKIGGARPLTKFRARWPIAMLQQNEAGIDLFQIAHFNLTHRVGFRADGINAARHFFF